MNYVVLNGVISKNIKGLLIQSLPPISKPLMRTEVEEIDGRDGDIITKLGYSAYNKEMSIGLHGDYDVDDVIRFFASEGTVIFSNEPDKYYNYEIIEQIDLERLVRFRTATVTFHVQPFKHSAVDRIFYLNNQYLRFNHYSESIKGIDVSASDGAVSFSGTATEDVEIYIPVRQVSLNEGPVYRLTATSSGQNPEACRLRLIRDMPTNENSFGYMSLLLFPWTVYLEAESFDKKTYNYLYFLVSAGINVDFTVELELKREDLTSIDLINRGNTVSKPKITLYGDGAIELYLNGTKIFDIALGDEGNITIDAEKMEAFKGNALKNRLVTGNFENFILPAGKNTISWSGNVVDCSVEDFSRWI